MNNESQRYEEYEHHQHQHLQQQHHQQHLHHQHIQHQHHQQQSSSSSHPPVSIPSTTISVPISRRRIDAAAHSLPSASPSLSIVSALLVHAHAAASASVDDSSPHHVDDDVDVNDEFDQSSSPSSPNAGHHHESESKPNDERVEHDEWDHLEDVDQPTVSQLTIDRVPASSSDSLLISARSPLSSSAFSSPRDSSLSSSVFGSIASSPASRSVVVPQSMPPVLVIPPPAAPAPTASPAKVVESVAVAALVVSHPSSPPLAINRAAEEPSARITNNHNHAMNIYLAPPPSAGTNNDAAIAHANPWSSQIHPSHHQSHHAAHSAYLSHPHSHLPHHLYFDPRAMSAVPLPLPPLVAVPSPVNVVVAPTAAVPIIATPIAAHVPPSVAPASSVDSASSSITAAAHSFALTQQQQQASALAQQQSALVESLQRELQHAKDSVAREQATVRTVKAYYQTAQTKEIATAPAAAAAVAVVTPSRPSSTSKPSRSSSSSSSSTSPPIGLIPLPVYPPSSASSSASLSSPSALDTARAEIAHLKQQNELLQVQNDTTSEILRMKDQQTIDQRRLNQRGASASSSSSSRDAPSDNDDDAALLWREKVFALLVQNKSMIRTHATTILDYRRTITTHERSITDLDQHVALASKTNSSLQTQLQLHHNESSHRAAVQSHTHALQQQLQSGQHHLNRDITNIRHILGVFDNQFVAMEQSTTKKIDAKLKEMQRRITYAGERVNVVRAMKATRRDGRGNESECKIESEQDESNREDEDENDENDVDNVGNAGAKHLQKEIQRLRAE